MTKSELREIVRSNLNKITTGVNSLLHGDDLGRVREILERLGRNQRLPHWFRQLSESGTLPNLDGKTIGSVIEMLFVSVVEKDIFCEYEIEPLRINPASGVDIPDLDLGVKSPSENFCTSEPFFSPYERLIGSEYDIVVLLTDYQTAKQEPPLKLQIIKSKYLNKTQVADLGLCTIARNLREWLLSESEPWAKKVFRFLAYINQQDWQAKHLLKLVEVLADQESIVERIQDARNNYHKQNELRVRANKEPLPEEVIHDIEQILTIRPIRLGVIDVADNWVVNIHKDAARTPTENEWNRLVSGPLDGEIGMSFALQWRYNFGHVFR